MTLNIVVAAGNWGAFAFGVVVGALMLAAGLLVDLVARRAASGTLTRNTSAGIRSNATMASEEAWLAAHQAGERLTRFGAWAGIIGGAAAMVFGILAGPDIWAPDRSMVIIAAVILVSTVLMTALVLVGARQGQRAAKSLS